MKSLEVKDLPNPGSDEAIEMGCTCPVFDNCRGRGHMGIEGIFWINAGCPVHGEMTKDQNVMVSVDENNEPYKP